MNTRELNRRAREQWDAKAEFWDMLHGYDGNQFHKELISPAAERLLNIQTGEVVLDLACGNGVFSRRLAELGAAVIATDFSAALIERAKVRTASANVTYKVIDATDDRRCWDWAWGVSTRPCVIWRFKTSRTSAR
ncbi:MAG: class I SAM-dependent methyltransferase [Chloroflexi bacterium]|nr:class I SAM-dependent methyltransferase [Chloroflexota bacterium]